MNAFFSTDLAVVPILVGPLQMLLQMLATMLPAILLGIASALLALVKPRTFKLAMRILWRLKGCLLLTLAVIVGAVFVAVATFRKPTGPVSQAETTTHDWPAFRGGAQRTGALADSPSPVEGGIKWAFASEAKTFHSSPAILGNRLYVTSAEVGVFSTRGAIYCLDADTGGVVWKSAPEDFRATFSSPSIAGKYLVTGEGLHTVKDGRISCLDISRGGALLWSYRTKSHVESSAAIANGRAYIGAGDDGYYCFRLEPDAQGQPVLLWHLPGDKYPDAETDPLVLEGRVYLGLGINGQALVCVDAASGRELWRVPTPFPVFSPPAIARGKIFIGMGHGDFMFSAEDLLARQLDARRAAGASEAHLAELTQEWKTHGEVWCIDLATQHVDWRFKTDRTVLGAVVAADDRVFFATRGGTVYSVGFDGRPLATWSAHAPLLASPALTSSHLYVTSESGRLFALDRANLQPAWETALGAAGTFLSSPAIARGHVYVGTPEDGLLCLGQSASTTAPPLWAGHLGGAGAGGNPEHAALAERGAVLSTWPAKPGDVIPTITAPAAAVKNRIFVPLAGPAQRGVVCLRTDDATQQWFCETPLGVSTSPAASAKHVVFVEGAKGNAGRRLHFLDASSGVKLWSVEVTAEALGLSAITADAVLAEDQPGRLTSFDLTGKVQWRVSHQSRLAGPPALADALIIATTTTPDTLLALDAGSGKDLWRISVSESPLTGPITHRIMVLFGTPTGIAAHSILDGKRLWHAPVGEIKRDLVLCGDIVATVTAAGEFVTLDTTTGAVRAKQSSATPNLPPIPARDAFLYATPTSLARYDLTANTSELWLATPDFGTITSPLIMAGSSVWFATEKRGLIRAGAIAK
ncbi:MAG: PQQ-binding-like beta-propeller repeat protein [Chthoniobacter sp.]|nr:PQQ-binding-like beta-propeller repeat protein [Chthoniobacter sp.]